MKKTLCITAIAVALISASCGNSSNNDENRTDSAGVAPDTAVNLNQNGSPNGDTAMQRTDSSLHHTDSIVK